MEDYKNKVSILGNTLCITGLGIFFSVISTVLLPIFAQTVDIQERFSLPVELEESSGILFFNNHFITHEDSGGEAKLYELDTLSGEIIRSVFIQNASNIDWEDLAQDENYIYIADIGNNAGNRTDLTIYRINKIDYLLYDSVNAQAIVYAYADQTDFSGQPNNTPWDAEALISLDSLWLMVFTKDWVDAKSKAYRISKLPGNYTVFPEESILEAQGLITGATFVESTQRVYLSGYTSTLIPFVWSCMPSSFPDIFSGVNSFYSIVSLGFEQIESIDFMYENTFFMTSESFSINPISDYGKGIQLRFEQENSLLESLDNPVFVSPNPFTGYLTIDCQNLLYYTIRNAIGEVVIKNNQPKLDAHFLSNGMYTIQLFDVYGNMYLRKIIKE